MFFCLIVNPNILWAESVHVSCYANGLKHGFLDRIGPKSYADSAPKLAISRRILGFTVGKEFPSRRGPSDLR
jgi:hypothetical protein